MPFVHLDVTDRVARVRLDKPPVNPLSAPVVEELQSILVQCRLDPDIRAMVLTGSATHFAAGGDIKEFVKVDLHAYEVNLRRLRDCLTTLEYLPMPTIAAIEGPAVGGGWELALTCDIRIAARNARIGLPESKLGLLAAAGGTQRMLHLVGKGRLLEMLYTGKLLDAKQAHEYGLVERLAETGEAVEAAMELATTLADASRPALAAAKACVLAGLHSGQPAGLDRELEYGIELHAGDDAAEGTRAFVEKRPPSFQ